MARVERHRDRHPQPLAGSLEQTGRRLPDDLRRGGDRLRSRVLQLSRVALLGNRAPMPAGEHGIGRSDPVRTTRLESTGTLAGSMAERYPSSRALQHRQAPQTGRPLDDQFSGVRLTAWNYWPGSRQRNDTSSAPPDCLAPPAGSVRRNTTHRGTAPCSGTRTLPKSTHQALGNEAFTALFSEGTQRTSEHAIAYALSHET